MNLDKALSFLRKALNDNSFLKIHYRSVKGRVSFRSIQPREINERSEIVYIRAFCKTADDLRTFRLDCIQAIDDTPISNDTVSILTNVSRIPRPKEIEKSIRDKARPKCKINHCDNFASIRSNKDGVTKYRATCHHCRKKGLAVEPEKKLVKSTARPLCGLINCENLAEIKEKKPNGIYNYRKTCSSCRKKGLTASANKPQKHNSTSEKIMKNNRAKGTLGRQFERDAIPPLSKSVTLAIKKLIAEDDKRWHDEVNINKVKTSEIEIPKDYFSKERISNMPDFDEQFMRARILELREKVLNFARNNRLINYKHTKSGYGYIRAVDEYPQEIFDRLQDKGMTFKFLPGFQADPIDEQSVEFQNTLTEEKISNQEYQKELNEADEEDTQAILAIERKLADLVRTKLKMDPVQRGDNPNMQMHAKNHGFNPSFSLPDKVGGDEHQDNEIQTLLIKETLDRNLRNIYSKFLGNKRETGINTFYAVFGFLNWEESRNSELKNASPLLMVPIDIKAKKTAKGRRFTMTAENNEYEINETLRVKLSLDFGIELPDYDPEKGINSYFSKVKRAVNEKSTWSVDRYLTFTFLPFTKIEIYNDLDISKWGDNLALLGHENILKLLGGSKANEVSFITENEPIDKLTLSDKIPHLVLQADSSQHSAIKKGLEGNSLVIQGPPGTGKSQTIANLIAAAVAEGKKILFMAEKQPALEVVRQRLKSIGLSNIMFEPTVMDKTTVFDNLRDSLETSARYDKSLLDDNNNGLKQSIKISNAYTSSLNSPTNFCSMTLYDLYWRHQRLKDEFGSQSIPFVSFDEINELTHRDLKTYNDTIEKYMENQFPYRDRENKFENVINIAPNSISVEEFLGRLNECVDAIQHIQKKCDTLNLNLENFDEIGLSKLFSLCEQLKGKTPQDIEKSLKWWGDNSEIKKYLRLSNKHQLEIKGFSKFGDIKKINVDALTELSAKISNDKLNTKKIKHTLIETTEQIRHISFLKNFLKKNGAEAIEEFGQIKEICKLIKDFDGNLEAVLYHKTDYFNSAGLDILKKFKSKLKLYQQELYKNEDLKLDYIEKNYQLSEIKSHKETLKNAGILSRFSSNYKGAQKFLANIGLNNYSKDSVDRKLQRIIAHLTLRLELEKMNSPKGIMRENYKGHETDISDLTVFIKSYQVAMSLVEKINTINSNLNFKIIKSLKQDLSNEKNEEKLKQALAINGFRSNAKWMVKLQDLLKVKKYNEAISDLITKANINLEGDINLEVIKITDVERSLVDWTDHLRNQKTIVDQGRSKFKANLTSLNSEIDCLSSLETLSEVLMEHGFQELSNPPTYDELTRVIKSDLNNIYDQLRSKCNNIFGKHFDTGIKFLPENLSQIEEEFSKYKNLEVTQSIKDIERCEVVKEIEEFPIPGFFNAIEKLSDPDTGLVKVFFELLCVRKTLNQNAAVLGSKLSGEILRKSKIEYRTFDNNLYKLNSNFIKSKVSKIPVPIGIGHGPVRNWTEKSYINHEIGKKKRNSIRELIRRSFNAIIATNPVWLMQPVTVSKLLPKKPHIFDLLIIDEASQMLPEMAIPGMVRSKEVIVVGDEMQMPPSNIFRAELDYDEEDAPEISAESILDLASKRIGNSVSLNWHYRSQHPSLINFSNFNFYKNRLEVFPSPHDKDKNFGVQLIEANGIYDGGGINPKERDEVLKQFIRCIENFPDETIGIVAMNVKQKDLIQEAIEQLADINPKVREYIDRWEHDPLGLVFIKNLANVQGDERDIIIISTVYGRDENGNMFQRFPAINQSVGHRFLNVLFTRAKRQLVLVTSMKPADIKITENSSRGVKALRDYLEYAKTGKLEVGTELRAELRAEPDSDFEVSVGDFLKQSGLEVVYQVGVRGFKIDLGIKHKDYPYGFLAGIECDGATYHSSLQARDRDAIRQDILESLGWTIYRIWSTDWFTDEAREKEKFKTWISNLLKTKLQNTPRNVNGNSTPIHDLTEVEVQETNTPTDFEEEFHGPTGEEKVLEYNEVDIIYYKTRPDLFEIWDDERQRKLGDIERKTSVTGKIEYQAELLIQDNRFRKFDDIYNALKWVYDNTRKQ